MLVHRASQLDVDRLQSIASFLLCIAYTLLGWKQHPAECSRVRNVNCLQSDTDSMPQHAQHYSIPLQLTDVRVALGTAQSAGKLHAH